MRRPDERRYELTLAGEQVGELDYRDRGENVVAFLHTEVDPTVRARGSSRRSSGAPRRRARARARGGADLPVRRFLHPPPPRLRRSRRRRPCAPRVAPCDASDRRRSRFLPGPAARSTSRRSSVVERLVELGQLGRSRRRLRAVAEQLEVAVERQRPPSCSISSSAGAARPAGRPRARPARSGRSRSRRYRLRPVAAGISLPMITFSLRPSRRSILPSIDASVSTFVVSWKEAAERNDSVASDAFVMPEDERLERRRLAAFAFALRVLALEHDPVDQLAGQEVGVARVLDADLLQHLADDQLDVLVVDLDALRLVDLLHLARRGTARSASSP